MDVAYLIEKIESSNLCFAPPISELDLEEMKQNIMLVDGKPSLRPDASAGRHTSASPRARSTPLGDGILSNPNDPAAKITDSGSGPSRHSTPPAPSPNPVPFQPPNPIQPTPPTSNPPAGSAQKQAVPDPPSSLSVGAPTGQSEQSANTVNHDQQGALPNPPPGADDSEEVTAVPVNGSQKTTVKGKNVKAKAQKQKQKQKTPQGAPSNADSSEESPAVAVKGGQKATLKDKKGKENTPQTPQDPLPMANQRTTRSTSNTTAATSANKQRATRATIAGQKRKAEVENGPNKRRNPGKL